MGQAGLAEPRTARFTEWERRTLTRLAADGILSPAIREIRRLFRWLEDGGVVSWDPYRMTFWLADLEALARLLRWDAQRRLTAAYRAGKVTDATAAAS